MEYQKWLAYEAAMDQFWKEQNKYHPSPDLMRRGRNIPDRFDDIYCRLFYEEVPWDKDLYCAVGYSGRHGTRPVAQSYTFEDVAAKVEKEYGDEWDQYVQTIDGHQAIIDERREERKEFRQKEVVRIRRQRERDKRKRREEQKKRDKERFLAHQWENGYPMSFDEAFQFDQKHLDELMRQAKVAGDKAIAERDKKLAAKQAANQKRKETREKNQKEKMRKKPPPTSKSNQRMVRFLQANGDPFLCEDSSSVNDDRRKQPTAKVTPAGPGSRMITHAAKKRTPPPPPKTKQATKKTQHANKKKKAAWQPPKKAIPSWVIIKPKPPPPMRHQSHTDGYLSQNEAENEF